jgi:hypothetical protein
LLNRPQDHSGSALDQFEAFGEQGCITRIEFDVIRGSFSRLQSDGVTHDECDRFCFCLTNRFRRGRAALTAVHQLVSGLMDQTCEFFRMRLAGKESDPSAVGDAQCRSDLLVVFESNVLLCEEVDKAVPVDPNLARNTVGELWNIIPDSLALVLSRDLGSRFHALE